MAMTKWKFELYTSKFEPLFEVRESGCWEWIGSRNEGGYGIFIPGEWGLIASRAAYVIYVGPIPPGMLACHSCDNPPCVNPEHLFLGSHQDNADDMLRKGRGCAGRRYPKVAMTDAIRQQLLGLFNEGVPPADAAKLCSVSLGAAHSVWLSLPAKLAREGLLHGKSSTQG